MSNRPDCTYLTAEFPPTLAEFAGAFAHVEATNARCAFVHMPRAAWSPFKATLKEEWETGAFVVDDEGRWLWGAQVIDLAPAGEAWLYGETYGAAPPYTVRMRRAAPGEVAGTTIHGDGGPPAEPDPEDE